MPRIVRSPGISLPECAFQTVHAVPTVHPVPCMCEYICMHIFVHIFTLVPVLAGIYAYICTKHTVVHVRACTYTRICAHIGTHTHIYTCVLMDDAHLGAYNTNANI